MQWIWFFLLQGAIVFLIVLPRFHQFMLKMSELLSELCIIERLQHPLHEQLKKLCNISFASRLKLTICALFIILYFSKN
ncbi:hypothetical protein A4A49_52196 [Nicotiana attenuata]|uniref:Uncharacterized protein n=1 Tax=Nicotiana attenuata TaxID=49451 RepID=A0A314KLL3_NICAT|nr:hypothetical protein A4A49_52196 [Nicotiana attenuata]